MRKLDDLDAFALLAAPVAIELTQKDYCPERALEGQCRKIF
jgi:hypothetical protein